MADDRSLRAWFPVGILAFATVLRLWAIDRLPPGLYFDEAADGLDATRVLAGVRPIFFTGNYGREPLSIYAQAVAIWLEEIAKEVPRGFVRSVALRSRYLQGSSNDLDKIVGSLVMG